MENSLLLIKPASGIINKVRSLKSFPVPSSDGNISRIIGLVDITGLRVILRVSPGNCSESFNCENWFPHIELSEFYSIVGNAKYCTVGQVKSISPPMRVPPSLFSQFPQWEGHSLLAESYDNSVNQFILYREPVSPLPIAKPAYSGLLAKAMQEV